MSSTSFKLLMLVGCLFLSSVVTGQDLGNECVVRKNNKRGICSYIGECPHVMFEFTNGIPFTTCRTLNGKKVVCCTNPKPSGNNIPTSTSSTSTSTTKPPPLRIHEEKCFGYQSAINKASIVSGTFDTGVITEKKCLFKTIPLIVGGENATSGEFPHMALLGYTVEGKVSWDCGGSLISEKFVLTAGHCLDTEFGKVTVVRLGELDYSTDKDNDKHEDIDVLRTIPGPGYLNDIKYNDIGLVELAKIVTLTPYIRPACLPSIDDDIEKFIATGWGLTSFSGDKSPIMQKVVLEWFQFDRCDETYKPGTDGLLKGVDSASQFCAGSKEEKKDACQGDSGGPMQIYHPQLHCMYTLVGITSFGQACATPDVPGIYTNIYYYIDWIEGIVWKTTDVGLRTSGTEENIDVRISH